MFIGSVVRLQCQGDPGGTDVGLRELRRRRGWTLEAVARLTGLDAATISRLERGLTANPSAETVVALARNYGVSVARMDHLLAEARKGSEADAA